ncbi:MAG: hypothetical protein V4710_01090, partial [Verrucomicrobiota bacterium]
MNRRLLTLLGVIFSFLTGTTFAAAPVITAFSVTPTSAYEGATVKLSWTVNTTPVTGTYSYTIKRGATQITSGTAASGTFDTAIPDLTGTAQPLSYILTAIETGGASGSSSQTIYVNADP